MTEPTVKMVQMSDADAIKLLREIHSYGRPEAICGHEEDGHTCAWCNEYDKHTKDCPWPKLEEAFGE